MTEGLVGKSFTFKSRLTELSGLVPHQRHGSLQFDTCSEQVMHRFALYRNGRARH